VILWGHALDRRTRVPDRRALPALALLLLVVRPASGGAQTYASTAVHANAAASPVIATSPSIPHELVASPSADRNFRLQFGLLVHADGRLVLAKAGSGRVNPFAFRRIRPSVRGTFARRFEFYFNPDFAGGTLVVQDAYVDAVFGRSLRIRAGKGKTPFGLERLHAASNILFFSRALPTALAPNRDIGVQILGDLAGGRVSYIAALMQGVADGESVARDRGRGKDVSGRLIVRPFSGLESTPLTGLGLAIAISTGRQSGPSALPTFRTTSLERPFFAYEGAGADGVRRRYSPQVFYYHKSFGGFAEWVHTTTPIRKEPVRTDIGHSAWQIAGSIVLSGESATDAGAGVQPRHSFDLRKRTFGAFQISARYHALAVDHRALTFGLAAGVARRADAWTVGANWYLTQHLRYTLNFERTVLDDHSAGSRPAEKAFVARTQVNF
jgi:phosphate-selective porin OprO/OprP